MNLIKLLSISDSGVRFLGSFFKLLESDVRIVSDIRCLLLYVTFSNGLWSPVADPRIGG